VTRVYRKNLRGWEQWSRLVVGAAVIGAGSLLSVSVWLEVAIIVAAAGLIGTAIVGYCPA
jgi:hypothetical protein